jgi:hypothetical protein
MPCPLGYTEPCPDPCPLHAPISAAAARWASTLGKVTLDDLRADIGSRREEVRIARDEFSARKAQQFAGKRRPRQKDRKVEIECIVTFIYGGGIKIVI